MFPKQDLKWREFTEITKDFFYSKDLACAAIENGFMIRARKIFPTEFLMTLIFGFYSKEEPTITTYHRLYRSLVGEDKKVVYSSFYDRFNENTLKFVDACLNDLIDKHSYGTNAQLKGYLQTFKDVLIKDNTIVRVHEFLADKYPATRKRRVAAGIKIAVLLSVKCNTPLSVTFHPENTNDSKTLKIGSWVKDTLLLMDRGFFKYDTFAKIDSFGGSYITRLKLNTKAEVLSVSVDIPENIRNKAIGKDFRELLELTKPYGHNIDGTVKVSYLKGEQKKKKSSLNLRFIAIYNADTEDYHTYFTNIPASELGGSDVAALYAARWDIENLFRELKSENLLGRIESKNEYITEIFIRIPIMRLLITRKLFAAARNMLEAKMVLRLKKRLWSIVFAENSKRILTNLMKEKRGRRINEPWFEIWDTIMSGSISGHLMRMTHTSLLYI